MKHLKRRHLFLIIFFLSLSCIQHEYDQQKSLKYKHFVELLKLNVSNYNECAERLFKYAQTDYEKSYANYIMGNIMYKESKYKMAVDYFESAKRYGKNTDSIDLQRYYTNGLVYSYRRAGLIEQSDEAWELEKKMNEKSKDPYTQAEYYYNLSKIYDIDKDYCKSAEAKREYLKRVPKDIFANNANYIFGVYSQLAFVQIKCGNLHEGEKILKISYDLVQDKNLIDNYSLYELFILSNALLAVKRKNNNEAKMLFNLAYTTAKKHQSLLLKKLILSERLEANIDDHENQILFLKEISQISQLEKESTITLTRYETLKSKEEIQQQEDKTLAWLMVSAFSIGGIILLLIYNRHKNRKIRAAYERIIENLDQKNSPKQKTSVALLTENKEIENEKKIVKQLEILEQKQFFTTQNMSAAQMAVLLKITPRNLSYVLKKYRNEDFYNYLNNIRIDYFTAILRNNPKYRNYKISVLSEMVGYSSHSQFAINFKNRTGITPSQYISFLEKEHIPH